MLDDLFFRVAYLLSRPEIIRCYDESQKTQWKDYEYLRYQQETKLRNMISYAYKHVLYYTQLLDELSIKPEDITTVKDLQQFPILTKKAIKDNWHDFIPDNMNKIKYKDGFTSGSTGIPLNYRMSVYDYERGLGLMYRGWGYAGYRLGDKVATIGGSSIMPVHGSRLKSVAQRILLHIRYFNFSVIGHDQLLKLFHSLNRWRPVYLRCYGSCILSFALYIRNHNLKPAFRPKGIFCTAETLMPWQRKVIEEILQAPVFDQYGLNDGGVSAYECEQHDGKHIDTERAILEVVDDDGKQIIDKRGRILATNLYNHAFPFIRYDTGDLGIISDSKCICGRNTHLLRGILGRANDHLELNGLLLNNQHINILLSNIDIDQYQIVQDDYSSIIVRIIKGKDYKKEDEALIRDSFTNSVGKINIHFDYVVTIPTSRAGKHRFIINNIRDSVATKD
ncbi:phenylacetate--CoA ligase family protein [Chloroflexota bacterium]